MYARFFVATVTDHSPPTAAKTVYFSNPFTAAPESSASGQMISSSSVARSRKSPELDWFGSVRFGNSGCSGRISIPPHFDSAALTKR